MIKKSNVIIAFLLFISLSSCNDCPLIVDDENRVIPCNVLETTVTEFNADFIIAETIFAPNGQVERYVYEPGDRFSIHSFRFPFNSESTGTLPNNLDFEKQAFAPLASQEFRLNNRVYTAAIIDNFPTNKRNSGDMLIQSVNIDPLNPNAATAICRFYNPIVKINRLNFFSENSREFCGDIVQNVSTGELNTFRQQNKLPQTGVVAPEFNRNDIKVFTENGVEVLEANVINAIPARAVEAILKDANEKRPIEYTIELGGVYFYQARNGKEFIFAVSNIMPGTFAPQKNRVTLMFNPVNE